MAALQLSLLVLFFPILGLTGQEGVIKFVGLHGSAAFLELHRPGYGASAPAMAVSVAVADLPAVSSSVLQAETWLRRHVLSVFPSGNVTAIVVGRGVLCTTLRARQWDMVLPSVKNLHHSLLRWGLEREIMVSAAFSSDCLGHHSAVKTLKPSFLLPSPHPLVSPAKTLPHHRRHSPQHQMGPSPSCPPPHKRDPRRPTSSRFLRRRAAVLGGAFGGPGRLGGGEGPVVVRGEAHAIPEALQEAMDYACGEGGADCEEIKPHGSCFYPDHIIAHASFAFNSYWQKSKKTGGSCDFQGPLRSSTQTQVRFLHCRYVLG
ncbi:unnamed protein product [Spirodela intermedia]|uniref:X8 domain-containing protein n=1 Tax=Spirodela intermedia TaxID=51605 RepID=A0A7I8JB20_SPIIN|nr:unnamed protein product [Spirodela intermedia]CAA6667406.1 unnamed protein product [Spirodela intermedia]